MRWKNKGHELDKVAKIIGGDDNKYFLWGAALAGQIFLSEFADSLNILGFIDSDYNKQGGILGGYHIYSPEILHENWQGNKIIITSISYGEISKELAELGYKENESFFKHTVFATVFYSHVLNKVFLNRVDISLTEKCTLNCKKCNMFMPYFSDPADMSPDVVKEDIDVLFGVADKVNMLNLLGGEPFMYPHLKEVIEYIVEHYKDKINRLEIFTNATIVPENDLLQMLSDHSINVQISDYSSQVPYEKKVKEFKEKMESYMIPFTYYNTDKWVDFGYPEHPNTITGDENLISFFDRCAAPFRGLYRKKLWYCQPNLSAVRANIFEEEQGGYFDLGNYTDEKQKELLEFELGYSELGFLKFCTVCRGCERVNGRYVIAAEQMEKR